MSNLRVLGDKVDSYPQIARILRDAKEKLSGKRCRQPFPKRIPFAGDEGHVECDAVCQSILAWGVMPSITNHVSAVMGVPFSEQCRIVLEYNLLFNLS